MSTTPPYPAEEPNQSASPTGAAGLPDGAPGYQAPPQGTPVNQGAHVPPYGASPSPHPYQTAEAAVTTVTLNYWLSVFFTWIPALIFMLVEKGKNQLADTHIVANMNFSLLRVFVGIGVGILTYIPFLGVIIGVLGFIVSVGLFVLHIVAAVKGSEAMRNGQTYRFPFNINIIK